MSLEVYFFDDNWWYSVNGQLKPLPGNLKCRDEAKEEARKLMEPESEDGWQAENQ